MEREKSKIKSTLIEDIVDNPRVVLEIKGKEYEFSGELPVKAAMIFEANAQILYRLSISNTEGLEPAKAELAITVLIYLINLINRKRYGELSIKFIEDNFSADDLRAVNMLYVATWTKYVLEVRSKVTPPKEQKAEAEEQQ